MKPFTKDATWEINYNAIKKLPDKQIILFACDLARLTLPIWEQQYPNDNRPRIAVETAELFAYGQATKNQVKKTASAANAAANAAFYAANKAFYVASAAYAAANSAANAFSYTTHYATDAANETFYATNKAINAVTNACHANPQMLPTIQTIYQQTTPITIPTTPILKAIANQIRITRNFQEYNILLDNLEEFHNIRLERSIPKGLSHYVLFHLTDTH